MGRLSHCGAVARIISLVFVKVDPRNIPRPSPKGVVKTRTTEIKSSYTNDDTIDAVVCISINALRGIACRAVSIFELLPIILLQDLMVPPTSLLIPLMNSENQRLTATTS